MTSTILALMTPKFRRLAVTLESLPVCEREDYLTAWCAKDPDGDDILKAIKAQRDKPMPPIGTDGGCLR